MELRAGKLPRRHARKDKVRVLSKELNMKKKRDWDLRNREFTDFLCSLDLDMDFEQFSKYHFRVLDIVDVWPGSNKYYIRGTASSKMFTSFKELENIFNIYR